MESQSLPGMVALAVVFSVPATGQIAVPTLAVGLDGILRQAVSWKPKPLRGWVELVGQLVFG